MKSRLRFGVVTLLVAYGLSVSIYGSNETTEESIKETIQVETTEDAPDIAGEEGQVENSDDGKYKGVGRMSVPKTEEGKYAVWATVAGTTLLFLVLFLKSRKLDQ